MLYAPHNIPGYRAHHCTEGLVVGGVSSVVLGESDGFDSGDEDGVKFGDDGLYAGDCVLHGVIELVNKI